MQRIKDRLIRAVTAVTLIATLAFTATIARADHGSPQRYDHRPSHDRHGYVDHRPARDMIRVPIPVGTRGPGTLNLKPLIRQQARLRLDDYTLTAVVVSHGPFSNGYATLRTGNRRSARYLLAGRDRVRIPAPALARDDWSLRLGPRTQVRTITVMLTPLVVSAPGRLPEPRARRVHDAVPALPAEPARRDRSSRSSKERQRQVDVTPRQRLRVS